MRRLIVRYRAWRLRRRMLRAAYNEYCSRVDDELTAREELANNTVRKGS